MPKWKRQCVDEGVDRIGMELAKEVARIAENDGKWDSVLAGLLRTKYGSTITVKKSKSGKKPKRKLKLDKSKKNPDIANEDGKRIIDWEALHKNYHHRRTEADLKEEEEFDKKWIKDAGFNSIEELLAWNEQREKNEIPDGTEHESEDNEDWMKPPKWENDEEDEDKKG